MHLYRRYILPDTPPKTLLITGGSSGIGRATALLFAALGQNVAVTDRTIDVHVAALRKKLGSAASCIRTVRGVGYTFRARSDEPSAD